MTVSSSREDAADLREQAQLVLSSTAQLRKLRHKKPNQSKCQRSSMHGKLEGARSSVALCSGVCQASIMLAGKSDWKCLSSH